VEVSAHVTVFTPQSLEIELYVLLSAVLVRLNGTNEFLKGSTM